MAVVLVVVAVALIVVAIVGAAEIVLEPAAFPIVAVAVML
jgi:hypothetical protein